MIALRLQDGKNFPKNTFLDDVKDMLTRAQAHSISIIPTLWSFEAMNDHNDSDTQFSGSHEGLFEFVSNALSPLLDG